MTLTKNTDGSYVINPRQPGLEAAAVGAGLAPDLNGDASFAGLEGGVEVTSGGLLSYAIYTAVLTALGTIPDVRSGAITRAQQREIILDRTWASTKGAVPTVVILAAVLALCPWLSGAVFVGGLIGAGVMTTRLVRCGIDALSDEQKQALKSKASEVGVNVPGLSNDEPLPSYG